MLQETSRDVPSKIQGQDGFANSFPVGLLQPQQHDGLPRRTLISRDSGAIPLGSDDSPLRAVTFDS